MESQPNLINVIFMGYISNFVLKFKAGTKIKYIIEEYFKKIRWLKRKNNGIFVP